MSSAPDPTADRTRIAADVPSADAPSVTGPSARGLWEAAGGWYGVATAVAIFWVTRVGQLGVLHWLGTVENQGTTLRQYLLVWDAGWFLRVATEGYPTGYTYDESGAVAANGLAFFPGYPMLIRGVSAWGLDPGTAALTVTWIASIAAAVALHLLGTSLHSRRAGWALVALCCAQPMSVVLSMAYSESLFLALVAGMLVAAHRRVWWAAGLLGLGAALSRPTGLAAALALAVAAGMAVREQLRARPAERTGAPIWQPIAAAAVALAGVPLFLGWVAWRVGDPDAWFTVQTAGWGTSFDFGASTWRFLTETLGRGDGWVPVSTALILLVALGAVGVALAGRPWLPLAVYGLAAMALVYGQAGFYHSKPRLLLPVLLVLLPAAFAAARARPRVAVPALLAWSLFGLWYGAHMVVVWPYTI